MTSAALALLLQAAGPAADPAAIGKAGPVGEWRKALVKDSVPAEEPLTGSALPDGARPEEVLCGPRVEYPIRFSRTGAGAELTLSFDPLCACADGGRYIRDIRVKAEKAFALPFKRIDVEAELPPTSLADCAGPGEPATACIDLVLSFNVSPFAGSWTHQAQTYTLRADGAVLRNR
jgi:hypothetical protein